MIKYIVEFIGTFFFLSVILRKGEPIAIAVGLAAAIYFGANISGANYNPAVSAMLHLNKQLSANDLGMYVLAQLAGAWAALKFHKDYAN